jgi:hypothetical protein
MATLSRQPTYVGREAQKALLHRWAAAVAAGGACRALCFEATGGLGKTRLLQSLPEILAQACPAARFAPVVDLYDVEHRGAEAIERRLIDGLAAPGPRALPASRVAAAFGPYHRLAAETLADRQFGDPDSRLAHGDRLREAFVAGWNSLAAEAPLVLRFDTLEALAAPPAPPSALVSAARALAERDLVGGWMRAVLPQLHRTLVILSGRPPAAGGRHELVAQIEGLGLLAEPVQRLEPLREEGEIRAYLRGHGLDVAPAQIPVVRRLTEGRPLLLTCWAAATQAEPPLHPPPALGSRPAFEDWLVDSILDPLASVSLAEQTVAYSLYALCYARRGLRPLQLAALLARLGLHCDGSALARIGDLALVKAVELPGGDTLLLLHDEVYQLIDQSGRPDALGLREPALTFLCELARAQVGRAGDRIVLLRAMADHVSYELQRDPAAGYGCYAVYVERLLREHNVEEAALLSELFWATVGAPGRRAAGALPPLLAALRERGLSQKAIARDEEARVIWLLHAQEQHQLAAAEAERQIAALAAAGAPLLAPADLPPAELRRHVALALAWAVAAARARPPEDHGLILERCAHVIAALEPVGEACLDALLRLRRDAQIGQAHLTRGQIHLRQLRFAAATADAEAAEAAFHRHEARADGPHDSIAYNRIAAANLTLALRTLDGDLDGALRLSAEMLRANLDQASPYHRALYACQHAALLLRGGQDAGLEDLLAVADEAALASGSKRAKGLLAHCRGLRGHQRMLAAGAPDPAAERHFAAATTLLLHEPGPRLEVCRDWAAFDVALAALYEAQGVELAARRHRLLAADLLDEYLARAAELPRLHAAELLALRAAVAPPAEAEALLAAAEARLAPPLPPFAHLIWGRTALRRAALAGPAEEARRDLLALAVAHMAAYAPRHAELDAALRQARAWAVALPEAAREVLAAGLGPPPPPPPGAPRGGDAWARAWARAAAELRAALAGGERDHRNA